MAVLSIINDDSLFENYTVSDKLVDVKLGDGWTLISIKIGNFRVSFRVNNRDIPVNIENVLYVKGMGANLLSSSKIDKNNTIIESGDFARIFNRQGKLIAVAHLKNNLYWLDSIKIEQPSSNVTMMPEPQVNVTASSEISLKEKWYRMLGHVNFSKLKILCEDELLDGAPKRLEFEKMKCAIFLENKLSNIPFNNDRDKAKEIL